MKSPAPGEIYRLKQDAVGKPRPVIIVSRQQLNGGSNVIAVPLTTQQIEKNVGRPNYVLLEAGDGGLPERSLAKCGEVSLIRISDIRLNDGALGLLDAEQMARVKAAIRWSLELDEG